MKRFLALAAAVAFAAPALADSVNFNDGTQITVYGVPEFATTGADMAGMQVTVYFSDGDQTSSWTTTGFTSGEASVAEWFRLSVGNDTFSTLWHLENLAGGDYGITGFSINAYPGNTVFDVDPDANGTAGSALGQPFEVGLAAQGLTFDANYWNIVALAPSLVGVGDLYGRLDVAISGGLLYGSGDNNGLYFYADTDNVVPTPEPATMALLGLGLGGAAWRRRRQRRQTASAA